MGSTDKALARAAGQRHGDHTRVAVIGMCSRLRTTIAPTLGRKRSAETRNHSMKKKTSKRKRAAHISSAAHGSAIPASKLLRAEATRLDVLKHAMPEAAEDMITAQVWAYNMAAAYLDALGAPERLVRYVPSPNAEADSRRARSARS